ncbi:hypothetical protein PVK06_047300 [Gossypium arboreum]|uniref:Uncharacterized protein n=1 Tax=Gossypium arboreum TaxID=29729 RepID=A0ABR0MEX8_GOSAR|nr:hypothetical protein PVK06_047300 [Gossypium arboreum]
MVIFFKQLEVDYVLFNPPITKEVEDSMTVLRDAKINAKKKVKYDKDNKMVRGHMLSHMANNLFDLFTKNKSPSLSEILWRRSMKLMMLGSRSMSLESGTNSR